MYYPSRSEPQKLITYSYPPPQQPWYMEQSNQNRGLINDQYTNIIRLILSTVITVVVLIALGFVWGFIAAVL